MCVRASITALGALALLFSTASVASPQTLELASRGPRFLAAWTIPGKTVDVTNAAVLRRRVSLDLTKVTANEALKEITRQADLEISYSTAQLPGSRSVSLHAREITVAAALTEVLLDAGVDVAVARGGNLALVRQVVKASAEEALDSGNVVGRVTDLRTGTPLAGATVLIEGARRSTTTNTDGRYRIGAVAADTYTVQARYIGYAPGIASLDVAADDETMADFALEKSVQQLEQVVVAGTIAETEAKAIPSPISVITAKDIQQRNLVRVDQLFRGVIPGAMAWDQGTQDYFSTVQVRGKSTLAGDPAIKTYIDGIELADAAYIAGIAPGSIDRIEITRGPQASIVYGVDALNGVMEIFTKKGSLTATPRVSGEVSEGAIQGNFSQGLPLRQRYSLAVAGGTDDLSYSLGGAYQHTGEWTPNYFSRDPNLYAGASLTQGDFTARFLIRYASKTFESVNSPELSRIPFYAVPNYVTIRVPQQTYGVSLSYRVTPHWQHNLIFGYDRRGFESASRRPRLATPEDTLLTFLSAPASRASVRYNTSYRLPLTTILSSVLTGGVEHYERNNLTDFVGDATQTTGLVLGNHFVTNTPSANSGYFGQVLLDVADALFVTAGLRGERNESFGSDFGTAWSPRVGASYVQRIGRVSTKLRASYGSAIRAPDPVQKVASESFGTTQLANPDLGPERQSGWDMGGEFYLGTGASLGITYYDQTAKGLIDRVRLSIVEPETEVVQFQNVGEIKNRGWELEGALDFGKVGVNATYSRTTSTVRRLGPTYGGDYRVGDALLTVPRNSAGATVRYSPSELTSLAVGLTYIGDWTGTDDLALLAGFFGVDPFRGSVRDYWTTYPSLTKFSVSLSQRVTRQVTGFVSVDNAGDNRRYELTNGIDRLGRVTTVGMRFQY